jgi:hypothetical protein
MRYKRNQVESAISRLHEPGSAKPGSEMRTRLKRLLATDRSLGRNKRSADPGRANFAFYSMDPPGRGVEIRFSRYEAFALLMGLRLMQHGWPQGFVVAVLRRTRPELEAHHDRTLRQDPAALFDEQQIIQQAKPGDLVVGNTDPVFLVITSRTPQDHSATESAGVCRGQAALMGFLRTEARVGWGWTTFELVDSIFALSFELARTKPSKRGRGSA